MKDKIPGKLKEAAGWCTVMLGRAFGAVKKSVKKDREKWLRGGILAVLLLVILLFVGNCACGKKKSGAVDEAAQGVMTITVAPSPTPTEAPRQVNSDAAATSGNVTMVNEYLVQKESQGTGADDTVSEAAEGETPAADTEGDGEE